MDQLPPAQDDNKLEFFEAMRDFRKMFPTIEDEVIEAVLRANNGAVDDTIDQLLVMSLDKDDNAYAETIPKRIGDQETASPRVDVSTGQAAAAAVSAHRLSSSSRHSSSNAASLPSYWLVDVEEEKAKAKAVHDPGAYVPEPSRKKVYRPPLIGTLPPDFLRISSSSDPWDDHPASSNRSSSRVPYSSRRSTYDYDFRRWEEEKQLHEGPPPSYAAAVGRRYSERATSTVEKSHYRSPQHAYLGIFRTTTMAQPPSPRRYSDNRAPNADVLKDAIAENEWKRRVARDPELVQYFEDEYIALMLQNEEFMRQLRNDQDFLAALERDAAEARRRPSSRKSSSSQRPQRDSVSSHHSHQIDPGSTASTGGATNDDMTEPFPSDPFPYTKTIPKPDDVIERSFQDKLTLMGRASKRKFATMARRFIRKNKGAKGVLDNNESRTHALLLDSDEDSDGGRPVDANAGYNQSSDADYNIGHSTDLKQGRFF